MSKKAFWFHGKRHRWGKFLTGDDGKTIRYCIDGFCQMGQYRNYRIVVARPWRKP